MEDSQEASEWILVPGSMAGTLRLKLRADSEKAAFLSVHRLETYDMRNRMSTYVCVHDTEDGNCWVTDWQIEAGGSLLESFQLRLVDGGSPKSLRGGYLDVPLLKTDKRSATTYAILRTDAGKEGFRVWRSEVVKKEPWTVKLELIEKSGKGSGQYLSFRGVCDRDQQSGYVYVEGEGLASHWELEKGASAESACLKLAMPADQAGSEVIGWYLSAARVKDSDKHTDQSSYMIVCSPSSGIPRAEFAREGFQA
ncbi:unnamed protein product [Effrenium voratum]|nr:unnamed protein product [Effrenium voratum]